MIKLKKIIQYPILFLLIVVLSYGSLFASIISFEKQAQLENYFSKTSQSLFVFKNLSYDTNILSCNRHERGDVYLSIKIQEKNNFIKLFFCVLSSIFLFKESYKETFIIYLIRIQYFLTDLDICILAAKAHPPTH